MSIVKEALLDEILERMTDSKLMYVEYKTAQTDIKKKIFKKKLKKNNTILADLLSKLDKLTNMT